jgi:hypothetical protein
MGRFISEDSLLGEPREPDSRHLYAYATGGPVGAWDPDGRKFSPGSVASAWLWSWNQVVAYGVEVDGVRRRIGQVRVTARVNLDGRHAQSTQTIETFSGPAIKATSRSKCWDDNNPTWFPDTNCGSSEVIGIDYQLARYVNKYTPYLIEDERYWFEYTFHWKPKGDRNPSTFNGHWYLEGQPAMSAAFTCDETRAARKVCIFK